MRDWVLDHYTSALPNCLAPLLNCAIAGGGPVELACGRRGSGGLDPPIQIKF